MRKDKHQTPPILLDFALLKPHHLPSSLFQASPHPTSLSVDAFVARPHSAFVAFLSLRAFGPLLYSSFFQKCSGA